MRFFKWFKRTKESAGKRPSVVAILPMAPVVYKFQCIRGFYSKEVRSRYVTNGVYSVRQGNIKLDLLVKRWVTEGKVRRGA